MAKRVEPTPTPRQLPPAIMPRLIDEGHTPRNWYGTDIVTALKNVDAARAARRPAPGEHNIAEIVLHHVYWLREVRRRLTGEALEAFALPGENWYDWSDESRLSWAGVRRLLAREVGRLRVVVADIEAGRRRSPLSRAERFDQVLGVAAHAAYHGGQIVLLKRFV